LIKRQQQKRSDKTTEEIEFEKNAEELTFHPNIQKKQVQVKNAPNKVNQRSVMDNIE